MTSSILTPPEGGRCLSGPRSRRSGRAAARLAGFATSIAIALSSCADRDPLPPPTVDKVAPAYAPKPEEDTAARQAAETEMLRERQIQAVRHSDPKLNWVNIGITTGKFSESIGSSVHKTYEECIQRSWMEDNACFPIAALPDSYWNAKPSPEGGGAKSKRTGA